MHPGKRHRTASSPRRWTRSKKTQLTPESHHLISSYYVSIDKVLFELELRFSSSVLLRALGNTCKSETPDRESFSQNTKILQNRRQDSGSRAANVPEFSLCARIRLHNCFRNASLERRTRLSDDVNGVMLGYDEFVTLLYRDKTKMEVEPNKRRRFRGRLH